MLVPVLTRPRSNLFRRRRGTAAKRPAESSTSASSCFHSEVISTSSTFLSAFQSSEKRPRIQGDDEARPAGSECSEVIGGARARSNEIELSESSCFGPVLESDLACPEKLADEAVATEYSSACDPLTPVEPEDEVVSGLYSCSDYSLSPLLDLSPLTTDDDDDDEAPSARFSIFLAFAKQFVPCAHPRARAATDPTLDLLQPQGKRFEDLDDEESYERFRRREQHGVRAFDYTQVYSSLPDSYCRLIGEQRVVMVNWIVEHSNVMKLQPATVFMGIGLMDRFLTRGYVKGLRNLQLMGIACITLATRIEENQPYNCVLLKSFKVGFNTYTRIEVLSEGRQSG